MRPHSVRSEVVLEGPAKGRKVREVEVHRDVEDEGVEAMIHLHHQAGCRL